ncbi:MAG: group 1 truncated hemoglobin [Hydrogenophilaceae bacterium]|jgi:hemoglobin|nr:group 1 truncated hemoglobin [Hydrogenophilaceae bacterium]
MAEGGYERVGGREALHGIVSRFYDKLVRTPSVSRHFIHVDLPRLVDHQTDLIATLLRQPGAASDGKLRDAHAGRGITEGEFEIMILILRESLEEEGVPQAVSGEIIAEMRKRMALVIEPQE